MNFRKSKNYVPASSDHSPFFSKEGRSNFFHKGEASTSEPFFNASGVMAKLTIGRSNDKFEKEADAMADKVVQRSATPELLEKKETDIQSKPLAANITPLIKTKCASCEQEDKLQKKEEDVVAGAPLDVQRKPIFESNAEPPDDKKNIQRKCAECEKEEKLQAKSEAPAEVTASPGIDSTLNNSKGGGAPIPASTKEEMENSLGADFSTVRLHTNSTAVKMNRDLNAQAFTHGSDIYFNAGKLDTNSSSGKHLLAHELTHVIQQGAPKDLVQRIPKNPKDTPFDAAVIPWSTPLREKPENDSKRLVDLPKGHVVKVLEGKAWIKVSTTFDGKTLEGYVSHEQIRQLPTQTPSPVVPSGQSQQTQKIEEQIKNDLTVMKKFHADSTAKLIALDDKGIDPDIIDPVIEHGESLQETFDGLEPIIGYLATLPQDKRDLIMKAIELDLRLFTQSVHYLESLDFIIDIDVPSDAVSNSEDVEDFLEDLVEDISLAVNSNSLHAENLSQLTDDLIEDSAQVGDDIAKGALAMAESTLNEQNKELTKMDLDAKDLKAKIADAKKTYDQKGVVADVAEAILIILSRGRARRARPRKSAKPRKPAKKRAKPRKSVRKTKGQSKTRQRKKRRKSKKPRKKPYTWRATTSIANVVNSGGIVGAFDYNYRITSGFVWHAHHSWPKFLGGMVNQPLMGIRESLHLSVMHPALLVYLKGLGHNVLGNQPATDPTNALFVSKLRTDMTFRSLVMAELIAFYKLFNVKSDVPIPANAYMLGIQDTFARL